MWAQVLSMSKLCTTCNSSTNVKVLVAVKAIHTTVTTQKQDNKHNEGPRKWLDYNKTVHPPFQQWEEARKAYVCHLKTNIKYSPFKMWYIASFIRGMSVETALQQLSFISKKGAAAVCDTIQEAQEIAVKRHNVEFKSNLWVAESFVGKGRVFRGVRRHARGRTGQVEYKHCHYFVRLEEGDPPRDYYLPTTKAPEQQFEQWIDNMKNRKITHTL